MHKSKLNQIELKTRDILTETLGDIESITPPINLAKILEHLNLQMSYTRFKLPSVSGASDKKESMIYLNKDEPRKRQFFTVAHELGHLSLDHQNKFHVFYRNQLSDFNGDSTSTEEEQEANAFAASLLMPKEKVQEFWVENPDIELLAAYFGVSRSAAYWRLKNLGLI